MNKITKTIALAVAALGVSGGVANANADAVVDGTALPQAVKQAKEGIRQIKKAQPYKATVTWLKDGKPLDGFDVPVVVIDPHNGIHRMIYDSGTGVHETVCMQIHDAVVPMSRMAFYGTTLHVEPTWLFGKNSVRVTAANTTYSKLDSTDVRGGCTSEIAAKEGNVFPVVEVPLSERGVTTVPLDEHNVIVIAPMAANTRD